MYGSGIYIYVCDIISSKPLIMHQPPTKLERAFTE